MEEYFAKNKVENEKSYSLMDISDLEKKYVEAVIETIQLVISFWNKVKLPVLIESKIE